LFGVSGAVPPEGVTTMMTTVPSMQMILEVLGATLVAKHGPAADAVASEIWAAMQSGAAGGMDAVRALRTIDGLLGGAGVDAVRGARHDAFWGPWVAVFVKVGALDAPTVLYDARAKRFVVAAVEDCAAAA
jgi:hypothetical protein